MANLKIKNKARCTPQNLVSVSQLSNNSVEVNWDNSGISYTNTSFEVSLNGGASYTSIAVISGTSPQTITSPTLEGASNGQLVKFRLVGTSVSCTNIVSNVVDVTWIKATIYVSNVIRDTAAGTATFNLHVEDAPFVGYMCGLMINSSVNSHEKLSSTNAASSIMALKINTGEPLGAEDRKNTAVNIPIGVYSCDISISANVIPIEEDVHVDSKVIWSLDTIFENGITETNVTATLDRIGIPE